MTQRPVGTKRWNRIRKRWESWTGDQWAPAVHSVSRSALSEPQHPNEGPELPLGERVMLMDRVVAKEALAGWDVVHRLPESAVFTAPREGPVVAAVTVLASILTHWSSPLAAPPRKRGGRRELRIDAQGHVWLREP